MNNVTDHLVIVVSALMTLLVAVPVTLYWLRKQLQAHTQATYQVNAQGLEMLEAVEIGGVRQWIHVRTRKRDNPVLLYLHGGPGWTHIGWYDAIQRPWEDYFTVVQWDQRQAGKSYLPMKRVGHTISHAQYISDAESMMAYLRERFSQDKIFIMGTSYGTYLGMQMVKRHPDWIHAYIGVGQVVKKMRSARVEHQLLLDEAKKRQDTGVVDSLEAMLPFPNPDDPAGSYYQHVYYLMEQQSRYGKAYPNGISGVIRSAGILQWMSPLYTLKDHMHRLFGKSHNAQHPFARSFMSYDLPSEIGSDFDAPVFFFTGRHDWHIPCSVTNEWFKEISAPMKEQVWFEHSAHVPFETEPGQFLQALVVKVLPLSSPYPLQTSTRSSSSTSVIRTEGSL